MPVPQLLSNSSVAVSVLQLCTVSSAVLVYLYHSSVQFPPQCWCICTTALCSFLRSVGVSVLQLCTVSSEVLVYLYYSSVQLHSQCRCICPTALYSFLRSVGLSVLQLCTASSAVSVYLYYSSVQLHSQCRCICPTALYSFLCLSVVSRANSAVGPSNCSVKTWMHRAAVKYFDQKIKNDDSSETLRIEGEMPIN
jgi:hypothetical protein